MITLQENRLTPKLTIQKVKSDLLYFLSSAYPRSQFGDESIVGGSLRRDEMLGISMICRDKHLSDRQKSDCWRPKTKSHHQMFNVEFFTGETPDQLTDYIWTYYETHVEKFVEEDVTTGTDVFNHPRLGEFPAESLSIYLTINPVSALKGYLTFRDKMNQLTDEVLTSYHRGGVPQTKQLTHLQGNMWSALSKKESRSRRLYVDLDVDLHEPLSLEDAIAFRTALKETYPHASCITQTSRTGYHVLQYSFRCEGRNERKRLEEICKGKGLKIEIKECEQGKHMWMPLPSLSGVIL